MQPEKMVNRTTRYIIISEGKDFDWKQGKKVFLEFI